MLGVKFPAPSEACRFESGCRHRYFNILKRSMPRVIFAPLLALLIGCASQEPRAEPSIAHVVNVHEGDIITALYHGRSERFRLYGIDCPEKDQAYSQEAMDATTSLILNQNVMIDEKGQDRH